MDRRDEMQIDIFRLGLQSDDVDLRDKIITYVSIAEPPGAEALLKEHIPNEELGWLKNFAVKVYEHLVAKRDGIKSEPPIGSEEDTHVGNRPRFRKTIRNMGLKK